MPIENIPSVMENGILSHEKAIKLPHKDISLSDIQGRRDKVKIGAYNLHQYANLYFCAHNPMLSRRRDQNDEICVLRVSKNILILPEVVLTDRNAGCDYRYTSFFKSPQGLHKINFDLVFAEYWTDDDPIEYRRKKAAKCAEVLVPHCIKTCYILGAYVANEIAQTNLLNKGFNKPITINARMFFM